MYFPNTKVHVMNRPTVDARTALFTTAQRKAEDTRVQIRKLHQASLKRGKYVKHSIELEEVCLVSVSLLSPIVLIYGMQFQKLTDRFVGEVDKVLAQLKKATGTQ
jgi:ribosome recycling factor